MPETIKPQTAKALRLIREAEITMPGQFASLMWPDGRWTLNKCGYGVSRGRMIMMGAGGFLGRLEKRGLIIKCVGNRPCYLTPKGEAALIEFDADTHLSSARNA